MDDDIFYKSDGSSKKFPLEHFAKLLPKNTFSLSQESLKLHNTEWRLKKFSINNKIYFEISFVKPQTSVRYYVRYDGSYIEKDIDPIYDKYVVDVKYWYSCDT